jgi:hypothetical protein
MSKIASSSNSDPDSRSLQVLLDTFGSRFSLDDIAAAYCQASQNVDVAGEILSAMAEKTPQCDQVEMKTATSKPTQVYVPKEVPRQEDSKAKVWRPKRNSISNGTVSSVIGKEYARTRPISNAPKEATKPLKINSRDIPETEIWSEEMRKSNEGKISRAPTDVEEFIVKMLGEGFQASQEVIHQVLGVCGYDVKKSTEKLLDFSDTKKYADVGISNEVVSFYYDFQFGLCYRIASSSKSDSVALFPFLYRCQKLILKDNLHPATKWNYKKFLRGTFFLVNLCTETFPLQSF